MIKLTHALDTFVLFQFQKIQDFFQDWTSIDCFNLSRASLLFVLAGMAGEVIGELYKHDYPFAFLNAFVSVRLMYSSVRLIQVTESRSANVSTTASPNPLSQNYLLILFRAAFVVGVIPFLVTSLTSHPHNNQGIFERVLYGRSLKFDYFGFLSFIYFVSCTPRPKKKSRVRKAVEALTFRTSLSAA